MSEQEFARATADLRRLLGAAACSVAVVSPDRDSLRYVVADGEGAAEIVGVDLPVGRGLADPVGSASGAPGPQAASSSVSRTATGMTRSAGMTAPDDREPSPLRRLGPQPRLTRSLTGWRRLR